MAVTVNVSYVDMTQQGCVVEGTLVLTGAYTTGGDTVNFSTNPAIPSNSNPRGLVNVQEQPASGTTPSGYLFNLIAGSTPANWLLFIATAVAQPPTQLGPGAYVAALTGATLQFRALFPYGQ